MPVAPTTATSGGRGGADDIVIYRFVARSMELEQVAEVRALLARAHRQNLSSHSPFILAFPR